MSDAELDTPRATDTPTSQDVSTAQAPADRPMARSRREPRAPVVLDANIVLGWCFGRAIPAASRRLLVQVRREGAQAPELLRQEAGGVIKRRAGGRSLSAKRASWFMAFFDGLPILYDPVGAREGYAGAQKIADATKLTVKDAAYLELALRTGAPLATRDRPLRAAAARYGVEVL